MKTQLLDKARMPPGFSPSRVASRPRLDERHYSPLRYNPYLGRHFNPAVELKRSNLRQVIDVHLQRYQQFVSEALPTVVPPHISLIKQTHRQLNNECPQQYAVKAEQHRSKQAQALPDSKYLTFSNK